jgi:hypothetical protein
LDGETDLLMAAAGVAYPKSWRATSIMIEKLAMCADMLQTYL